MPPPIASAWQANGEQTYVPAVPAPPTAPLVWGFIYMVPRPGTCAGHDEGYALPCPRKGHVVLGR